MLWKSIGYILLLSYSIVLYAEIITDGSLGVQTPLPNISQEDVNIYPIDAQLGQEKGSNLFHSFETFNLNPNEMAVFQADQHIQNIFTRVTNGQPSLLNGAIESPTNLYFLNPAGIIFGDSAALNINGSFIASTAHVIDFDDSGKFHTLPHPDDVLTTAPPTAFGFLTDNVAPIEMYGSQLASFTGQTFRFIGGDINLDSVTLFSQAGRIDLVSVASQGTVFPTATDIELANFDKLGTIRLSERNLLARYFSGSPANIDVSLPPETAPIQQGGNIFIRGENFIMQSGSVFANNIPSGKIDIELTGELVLTQTSLLETDNVTEGVFIQAAEIKMHDINVESAQLAESITALLEQITFNSEQPLDIAQFDQIVSSLPIPPQLLTQLLQTTYQQVMTGFFLQSELPPTMEQTEQIIASNIAQMFDINQQISIQTIASFMDEKYGTQAKDDVLKNMVSGLFYNFPSENGISVGNVNSSEQGGTIEITADTIDLTDSVIQTGTIAIGDGGNITVNSNTLRLNHNAFINTSSTIPPDTIPENINTLQIGNAGNISIQTNELDITNRSSIGVNTSFSNGDAGNIDIQATDITLSNQGYINSFNSGDGKAGDITIETDNMFVTDSGLIGLARQGLGGNINIKTNARLFVTDSIVDTRSFNNDAAGNIGLDSSIFVNNAELLANSVRGNGGDVTISASQYLPSSESIINNTSKFGIDGEILINAPTIDMMQFEPQPTLHLAQERLYLLGKCLPEDAELTISVIGRDASPL